MPFEKKPEPRPSKWEITYEDEDCISVWRYNTKKNPYGPIEVEYKYKKGYEQPKTKRPMKDLIKKD